MPGLSQTCKLGELLLDLNLISERELDEVIQLAMQINLPLGRALILSNRLKEDELRAVLQLQHLLRLRALDRTVAREAFLLARKERIPVTAAIEALGKSNFDKESQRSKLATFLLDAELVTEEQVAEAQRLSFEAGTPVGRMLALSGSISFSTLARAVELQVLVREGKISYTAALNALRTGELRELPAEESARIRGITTDRRHRVRLGELMMLAGILTENDLLNVIEAGLNLAAPLGQILVESGLVTEGVLALSLRLQEKIERGEIDIQAAVAELQKSSSRSLPAALPALAGPGQHGEEPLKLGELLRQSGLIDDKDIEQAVDLSTRYPAMLGKMLVVTGAIDEGTLLAALRCQYLVRNRLLPVSLAVQALQYAQRHRVSLDDALEDLGHHLPEAVIKHSPE